MCISVDIVHKMYCYCTIHVNVFQIWQKLFITKIVIVLIHVISSTVYHGVPGNAYSRTVNAHACTIFHAVNVAASMQIISQVSTCPIHADQGCEFDLICLSAHGRLRGTLWYDTFSIVACTWLYGDLND
jgi:uncharacterized membrane protein YagU involved in acid resistance